MVIDSTAEAALTTSDQNKSSQPLYARFLSFEKAISKSTLEIIAATPLVKTIKLALTPAKIAKGESPRAENPAIMPNIPKTRASQGAIPTKTSLTLPGSFGSFAKNCSNAPIRFFDFLSAIKLTSSL